MLCGTEKKLSDLAKYSNLVKQDAIQAQVHAVREQAYYGTCDFVIISVRKHGSCSKKWNERTDCMLLFKSCGFHNHEI